jgi:hypothetical protein
MTSMLPGGLGMDTNGLITGTPLVSGSFTYDASVSDPGVANPVTKTCSLTIAGPPTTACLVISATQGVALTSPAFVGQGGSGSGYTFSAVGLPTGLSMSATGVISGTSSVSGTFPYTITVTDSNHVSGTKLCSITVQPPAVSYTTVGTGDTATIGFWNNKNGQYILSILDSGNPPQKIGAWLASQYPGLFGNLANATCSDVSAQFRTYFRVSGTPKVYAQIMAGAIASYVTNTAVSGTDPALVSARTKFGFNSSVGGTWNKLYNVGSNGAAIGVPNNSSWTVAQLLNRASTMKASGSFTTAVSNAFNSIFDGINRQGDII